MKTVALLAVWVAEAAAVATTNVRVLPPLPNFLSKSCDDLEEREAKLALSQMTRRTVRVMGDSVQGDTDVATTFWESSARPAAGRADGLAARLVSRMREQPMLKTQPANTPASLVDGIARGLRQGLSGQAAPRVLLLHGADASILEWRFLVPRLNALGVDAVAVDWWSGGWTDREALLDQIDTTRPDAPQPWTVVRQHLHAFWRDQLNGEPVIVVGASLGGAVALDFAEAHPEAVAGLVLLDAGGESYKSPPPDVVSSMASVALGVKKALAFISARVPSEELRINNLHRSEPQWAEALGAYLSSGGYARQVDQSLIRNVAQPSLVVWGSEDPILPVADAYQFEKDLQQCVGVREVAGCGHTPQLEDPDSTALHVAQFAIELADARR